MKTLLSLSALLLLCIFPSNAQSIYRTACQGNITRLDSLLQQTNINTQDERGRSLLHWAVGCNKKDVFDHLVTKGIAVTKEDNDGVTPLYMAVRFQNVPLFDRMLELQPNTDWKKRHGGLLLGKAVLNKDLFFVQQLVANGVDIDAKNERGNTPLAIAQKLKAEEIVTWLTENGADKNLIPTIVATGNYMGQEPPGNTAKVFAPNFISTEEYEFGSVFNADGTEFYYGVDTGGKSEIRYSELQENKWSAPRILLSHEQYGYNDPFLSPDENRLYFISNSPMDGVGEQKDIDIWYVNRTAIGWSEPINAGPNINTRNEEYYISFTKDGTMYFSTDAYTDEDNRNHDIYYSKFVDGGFQKAVRLGDAINTDAYEADVFVDPNEDYLIFCAQRPEGLGRGDLYISFKNDDGTWSKSVTMGDKVNTEGHELCPFVTQDGKYLFYTSKEDIYWISTEFFPELKM